MRSLTIRYPHNESKGGYLAAIDAPMAAHNALSILNLKFLPRSLALLAIEFNLGAFVCVKCDVLDLRVLLAMANAYSSNMLVRRHLKTALKLLPKIHLTKLLS